MGQISGYQKSGIKADQCEEECDKYAWCKGYRIKTGNTHECRLLTDYRDATLESAMESDGWHMYNGNRWVEPDEWKDGNYHGQYECYAKIDSGKKFVCTY